MSKRRFVHMKGHSKEEIVRHIAITSDIHVTHIIEFLEDKEDKYIFYSNSNSDICWSDRHPSKFNTNWKEKYYTEEKLYKKNIIGGKLL